jgi:hypothetical protein
MRKCFIVVERRLNVVVRAAGVDGVSMTSRTLMLIGLRALLTSAMQMSRSVTTPETLPRQSTTGRKPQRVSRISRTACGRLVSGPQV